MFEYFAFYAYTANKLTEGLNIKAKEGYRLHSVHGALVVMYRDVPSPSEGGA